MGRRERPARCRSVPVGLAGDERGYQQLLRSALVDIFSPARLRSALLLERGVGARWGHRYDRSAVTPTGPTTGPTTVPTTMRTSLSTGPTRAPVPATP